MVGLRYNRRQILALGAGAGIASCQFCAQAHAAPLNYNLQAQEIASGTYAVFGDRDYFSGNNGGNIVNVAFIEVPDGIVVVDSGPSYRYGEALLELIEKTIPGKTVIRVFNTHHHPDHVFGNQAFKPSIIAAPQKVIDNIAEQGTALADNMYRLVGDWMRGTAPVKPELAITTQREDVGGRVFHYYELSGHTNSDLVIRDETTGVVFAGDLAFLNRAPTTPNADIAKWRSSLNKLAKLDYACFLPGHGPLDPKGEALLQTGDYLDWLDGTIQDAVSKGLTMNETMAIKTPSRFRALGAVDGEFQRSVVHLYPDIVDDTFHMVPVQK